MIIKKIVNLDVAACFNNSVSLFLVTADYEQFKV